MKNTKILFSFLEDIKDQDKVISLTFKNEDMPCSSIIFCKIKDIRSVPNFFLEVIPKYECCINNINGLITKPILDSLLILPFSDIQGITVFTELFSINDCE